MATEFKLPELGENIEEGDVVSILVSVGDSVSKDQPVIEMETGKANLEIPVDVDGVVKEIKVKEGEKATVGQTILVLEEAEGKKGKKKSAEKPEPATPKKEEPAKPADAKPEEAEDETDAKPEPAKPKTAPKPETGAAPSGSTTAPASPSTRKFAREIGVSIDEIEGTGPGGRVTEDDVKAHARVAGTGTGTYAAHVAIPDYSKWGEVEIEKLSNVRQATADHLTAAWVTIPHVTIHDKVDITELEAFRKENKSRAERAGVKLTLTAFLVKVAAAALKVHPKFNTAIDMKKSQLVHRKFYNVGVAVDTERGLLVPVIRDVDKKNILQIAGDISDIADKAKSRKLPPEGMQGGCITITNIGGIGGAYFTPIVNSPESVILGVGRAQMEQVYRNGEFVPRLMLPLSLSFDHRTVDGADGATFLRWIIQSIEHPMQLFLEG